MGWKDDWFAEIQSQKGGRGELLPWRPDSREKGNKDHRMLSPDTEGKVRSANREGRTGGKKNAAWPGLMVKGEKRTEARWKPVLLLCGRKFPPGRGQIKESEADCQRPEVRDARRVQKFRKIKEDYHSRVLWTREKVK